MNQNRPSKTPTVSVIVPTLNEAENLPQLFSAMPDMVDEVVLVDGNSTDDTIETARRLRPDVKVVFQKGKGKGDALRAGFAAASGDIVVMLDADGSTDPGEIPSFVGTLQAGADFAKGSRFMQGGGTSDMEFHRNLGNQGLVWAVRLLFGGKYTDLCYGYNAFWAYTLPFLHLDVDGFAIETQMNVRMLQSGLKIAEVPSFENRRFMGISNLNALSDGIKILFTIIKEWRKKPLRTLRPIEGSVTTKAFKQNLVALMEDMVSLSKARRQFDAENYEDAKASLLERFDALMKEELHCSYCLILQKRYSRYYRKAVEAYLSSPYIVPEEPRPAASKAKV